MQFYDLLSLDRYDDQRGSIQNMIPNGVVIRSALYITGNKGAVRGQHYHKKDVHYCYVIQGEIDYVTKNRQTGEITTKRLTPGMMVANEGDELHKFVFVTDGAFIALATEPRNQDHYEADTVRENF